MLNKKIVFIAILNIINTFMWGKSNTEIIEDLKSQYNLIVHDNSSNNVKIMLLKHLAKEIQQEIPNSASTYIAALLGTGYNIDTIAILIFIVCDTYELNIAKDYFEYLEKIYGNQNKSAINALLCYMAGKYSWACYSDNVYKYNTLTDLDQKIQDKIKMLHHDTIH